LNFTRTHFLGRLPLFLGHRVRCCRCSTCRWRCSILIALRARATFDSLLQEAVCILELETGLKLDPDAAIPLDEAVVSSPGSEQAGSDLPPAESVKVEPLQADGQSGPGAGPTLAARPQAPRNFNVVRHSASPESDRQPLPVVLSPDPSLTLARPSQP
jgi:hypothetical protein